MGVGSGGGAGVSTGTGVGSIAGVAVAAAVGVATIWVAGRGLVGAGTSVAAGGIVAVGSAVGVVVVEDTTAGLGEADWAARAVGREPGLTVGSAVGWDWIQATAMTARSGARNNSACLLISKNPCAQGNRLKTARWAPRCR